VVAYRIRILKSAITDFEDLRKKASERAKELHSMFWWALRDAEIAFCFEKHGAAICFEIYCINNGIPSRSVR
jgi:hypothetical protein